jgi:hypothetical protein
VIKAEAVLEQGYRFTKLDVILAEIEKLMQAINKCKKSINDRKKLQEEQSANIEYEVQKIQNIIQFITPEK